MKKTIGITGHRKLDHELEKIKSTLNYSLYLLKAKYGYGQVITGMALGFDQIVAEVCIDLNLPFIAAKPYEGQEDIWNDKQKEHYKYLISKASKVEVICGFKHANWKLFKRNEWIVNNSDLLLSYWNSKESGGTYHAISYAKANKLDMKHKNLYDIVENCV